LVDLARAVATVVHNRRKLGSIQIFNLQSFQAAVLKVATTVASITGASLDVEGVLNFTDRPFLGHTLDCTAFKDLFGFNFLGTLSYVLTEFDQHVPDSITSKGFHMAPKHQSYFMPCPICGSVDQQMVLDLGNQPFADVYLNEEAKSLLLPRFPLKLVRCKACNHFHLSEVSGEMEVFAHHHRQSERGNLVLARHFKWLAKKVVKESGHDSKGSVLDIGCNDGSFLDHFKQFQGWTTFGVDPEESMAFLAGKKGHTIHVGFWDRDQGLNFDELTSRNELTAIVAQNVLSRISDPVEFLKACSGVMGRQTKLYIQTTQCDMLQPGQFGSINHRHISYFTAHSFQKVAELSGLYITSFEKVDVEEAACLVTMKLKEQFNVSTNSLSLSLHLSQEKENGITSEFTYEKYAKNAHLIRDYLVGQINDFRRQGFTVGGFNPEAQGITLLHFLMNDSKRTGNTFTPLFEFILDDAVGNQDIYCPGTSIPVLSHDKLVKIDADKPMLLVVFARHHLDEISGMMKAIFDGVREKVIVILPFPIPSVVQLDLKAMGKRKSQTILRTMPYHPTLIPNVYHNNQRNKTLLITHLRNEEMLMPFFIIQHAPMFDHAIHIDFDSNDKTHYLVEKYAPPSWRIVSSVTGKSFDVIKTDDQVMAWEMVHNDQWSICLTITEFLMYPNLRQSLHERQLKKPGPEVIQFRGLEMVGNDLLPLQHFTSLPKQRHEFAVTRIKKRYNRMIHVSS